MRTLPTVVLLPLLATSVACTATTTTTAECTDDRCVDDQAAHDGERDVIPVVAGTSHPTKEISFKPLDAKDAKTF